MGDKVNDTTDSPPESGPVKKGQKSRRGFASISPERQREIASLGGKAAHAKGLAHEFSRTEAQAAGRRGGIAVSRDRAHMAEIGRIGGRSRKKDKKAKADPS